MFRLIVAVVSVVILIGYGSTTLAGARCPPYPQQGYPYPGYPYEDLMIFSQFVRLSGVSFLERSIWTDAEYDVAIADNDRLMIAEARRRDEMYGCKEPNPVPSAR